MADFVLRSLPSRAMTDEEMLEQQRIVSECAEIAEWLEEQGDYDV